MKIRVINDKIIYNGVEIGTLNENSVQSLDFKRLIESKFLEELSIDSGYYIEEILNAIKDIIDLDNIKDVKSTIIEHSMDIEDLERMNENIIDAGFKK